MGLSHYKNMNGINVRLTAEDGYQAERSYSIASAPQEVRRLALTVERIEGGER